MGRGGGGGGVIPIQSPSLHPFHLGEDGYYIIAETDEYINLFQLLFKFNQSMKPAANWQKWN